MFQNNIQCRVSVSPPSGFSLYYAHQQGFRAPRCTTHPACAISPRRGFNYNNTIIYKYKPEGLKHHRQGVECIARNPCNRTPTTIEPRRGDTESQQTTKHNIYGVTRNRGESETSRLCYQYAHRSAW